MCFCSFIYFYKNVVDVVIIIIIHNYGITYTHIMKKKYILRVEINYIQSKAIFLCDFKIKIYSKHTQR